MLHSHSPIDSALMEEAARVLSERIARAELIRDSAAPTGRLADRPPPPVDGEHAAREARRERSLQCCHRPSPYERPRFASPRDSGAYVPQLAARLDDDRNLTDGARRCARKLAELAYRRNRDGRCLDITVTYLMKALRRCRRSVQRYLRQLEGEGYIRAAVVTGTRSRMCAGLAVELLKPLFPRHHEKAWPKKRGNPDATKESQNKIPIDSQRRNRAVVPCRTWAVLCMDGVFRALRQTLPPSSALLAVLS